MALGAGNSTHFIPRFTDMPSVLNPSSGDDNVTGIQNAEDSCNGSEAVALDDVVPTSERVTEGLVLLAICIVAVSSNLFLWIVVLRTPELRLPSSYLILCLSFADLLVSAVNMPLTVFTIFRGHWAFSRPVCAVTGFSNMLAFVASVASLNSITFNRYIRVCRPARYEMLYSPAGQVLHIGGVWLFSAVLSLPPLFGWGEYEYVPTQYFCYCKWGSSLSYAIFMIVVCFGGTSTMMTSCYLSIYRTYTRSNRTISASGKPPPSSESDLISGKWEILRNYVLGSRNSFSPGISRRSVGPRRQGSSVSLTKYVAQWRHNSACLHKGSVKLIRFCDEDVASLPVNQTCPNLPSLSVSASRSPPRKRDVRRSSRQWFEENGSEFCVNLMEGPSDIKDQGLSVLSASYRKGRSTLFRSMTRSFCSASDLSAIRRAGTSTSLASQAGTGSVRGDRRRREEMRVTVTMLLVIFVYVISWLPYCVTILLNILLPQPLPRQVDMVVILLGYGNSLYNPFIYGLRNSSIKSGYMKLLTDIRAVCCSCRCSERTAHKVEFYL